jgi:hypothetical protein
VILGQSLTRLRQHRIEYGFRLLFLHHLNVVADRVFKRFYNFIFQECFVAPAINLSAKLNQAVNQLSSRTFHHSNKDALNAF